MTSKNILTHRLFLKKNLGYIAFFLPLLLLNQRTIAKDTTDQKSKAVLDIEIKTEGAFKPWFEKDFYKKHFQDPNYLHGDPDIAEKTFLNHKYKLLRAQQVQDLIYIGLGIVASILFILILESQYQKIADIAPVQICTGSVVSNKDGITGLLLKYFYNHWGTRGFISKHTAIDAWNDEDAGTVAHFFIKNAISSLILYLLPSYPSYPKKIVSLICFFSPPLAILTRILLEVHHVLYSHIIPMVKYWNEGEISQLVDDMQEAEIIYIRNQYRMPEKMQDFLENKLLEARRYPEKREGLAELIEDIVSLPTLKEAFQGINIEGDIDISLMEDYEEAIQDQAKRIYYRYVEGIKMHHTYLLGPPGVGKTYFMKLLAEALGANVATVSFAGVSVKDLIGYPPQDGKEGYIGRIAEAIQLASKKGKKSIILFVDEIDKALEGPYKDEINALCLELFESNNKEFSSPYLKGISIPLPILVVFAGNEEITGPFGNRLDVVRVNGYTWEGKRNILYGRYTPKVGAYVGNLDNYCKDVNMERKDLTKKDYMAIENCLKEMEKEQSLLPKKDRDPGMRKLEILILDYLFHQSIQNDFKKLKAQLEEKKKKLPKIKAF